MFLESKNIINNILVRTEQVEDFQTNLFLFDGVSIIMSYLFSSFDFNLFNLTTI